MKHVLVTGGAGYIGSHTCVELLSRGFKVTVVDNLSNSSRESLNRVKQICGKEVNFFQADICDAQALEELFHQAEKPFDVVIHFAGLKAVGESVEKPLEYYQNNIGGTLVLLRKMKKYGVTNIVFSSSATVYGDPATVPITEEFPLSCTNPYGRTKLMIEEILTDMHGAEPSWNIALLRYFNPVGAHKSGKIGENPVGIPNNIMPYISQVAVGKLERISVFGGDYQTIDGSGVRDYIHVVDLAVGHVNAIEKLAEKPGLVVYNLGTGKGYSVLELIRAFSKACGKELAYEITERRPGDIAQCFADPSKAERELGWKAEKGIEEMCEDTWRWQSQNRDGY